MQLTDSPDRLYLCVDGGGSKTAIAIIDNTGAVLIKFNAGPSNFSYLGLDGFLRVISDGILGVLHSSGAYTSTNLPDPSGSFRFAAAWFGIAGVDTPEAIAQITPRLCELLSLPSTAPRFTIANDTTLLAAPLISASKRNPDLRTCVACVGGTGSIAASFRINPPSAHGEPGPDAVPREIARVGGWGWILGDEGGGYYIGREAVRHLLRQHELAVLSGKPLDPPADDPDTFDLRTRVLALFGVQSAPELLAVIHDADPSEKNPPNGVLPTHRAIRREKRLSQLAPLVIRAAFGDSEGKNGGDSLALSVLRATSDELATQIALLLEPPSGPDPSVPLLIPAKSSLLILGGSLVGIPKYRNLVLEALKGRGHVFADVQHVSNAAETGGLALYELFNPRTDV